MTVGSTDLESFMLRKIGRQSASVPRRRVPKKVRKPGLWEQTLSLLLRKGIQRRLEAKCSELKTAGGMEEDLYNTIHVHATNDFRACALQTE